MRKVIIVLLFSVLLSSCGPMKGIETSEVSDSDTTQSQGPISSVTLVSPKPKADTRAESPPEWHTPSNWDRIKDGMSEKQVISILGRPTSTKNILYRTLFYRGEVTGSGFVSGNVELWNDRVRQVNKPVFDFN